RGHGQPTGLSELQHGFDFLQLRGEQQQSRRGGTDKRNDDPNRPGGVFQRLSANSAPAKCFVIWVRAGYHGLMSSPLQPARLEVPMHEFPPINRRAALAQLGAATAIALPAQRLAAQAESSAAAEMGLVTYSCRFRRQ